MKKLMIGNEAVARGAYEAGVRVVSSYPGTPSTEITEFCAKYPELRDALEKLQLNDASLHYEPETSIALGFGFRCGFLGLLHYSFEKPIMVPFR